MNRALYNYFLNSPCTFYRRNWE